MPSCLKLIFIKASLLNPLSHCMYAVRKLGSQKLATALLCADSVPQYILILELRALHEIGDGKS